MGWGSGGEIFEMVAAELSLAGISDDTLDRVLYRLALALIDQDWDTVEETIDMFEGVAVVQHALRKANGPLKLDAGNETARLAYVGNADTGNWELDYCDEVISRSGTVTGFNGLLRSWATRGGHDQQRQELMERYRLG